MQQWVALSVALSVAILISLSASVTIHTALRQVNRWDRRPANCPLVPARRSGLSRLGCALYALATEAWGWRYDPDATPYRCSVCSQKGQLSTEPEQDMFLRGMPRHTGVDGFCYAPDECSLKNGTCNERDRCQCLPGHDFASALGCLDDCYPMFEGFRIELATEDDINGTLTLDCNANGTSDLLSGFSFTEDGRLDAAKCPRFATGLRLADSVETRQLEVTISTNTTESVRTWCSPQHVLTGLTMPDGGDELELHCAPLLPPWVANSCFLQSVRQARPITEAERADTSLQWPIECSQRHQHAIRGAYTNNGTLVHIICCRIMEDCHQLP